MSAMKVEGPGTTRAATGAKKASKTKRAGGPSFASTLDQPVDEVDAVAAGVSAGPAGPVGAVDSLLALQEVDDSTSQENERRNRQARDWGDSTLDQLEEIRNGLLIGSIPLNRLESLASSMGKRKDQASDPHLAAIVGEIELRALVELAKHHRR